MNPMNSDPTNTLDLGTDPVGKNARNRFAIRGRALPVALWVAAAVAVTAIATFAITAAFGSGGPTLTPEQVAQALGTGPTTTGAGRTTTPATTAPTATNTDLPVFAADAEVFQTTPGTIAANCDGSQAVLVSWSPNPGYRVDDVVRGPAAEASVWFESDVADDVLVVATCPGGVPAVKEAPEVDDHGGGDDDNSGPGGGGGSGRDHPEDD